MLRSSSSATSPLALDSCRRSQPIVKIYGIKRLSQFIGSFAFGNLLLLAMLMLVPFPCQQHDCTVAMLKQMQTLFYLYAETQQKSLSCI